MKFFSIAFGVAATLAAGAASAGVVYDTTGLGNPAGTKPSPTALHGPLGDSFIVSAFETITSVSFVVKDATTDTGSVLIFLVPDTVLTGAPSIPSSSITTLNGAIPLGQIQDNGLFTTFGNAYTKVTLAENVDVGPGTYWIEMVDAASLANGNGNPTPTNLQWGFSTAAGFNSALGVPTSGNIFSTSNSLNNGLAGGRTEVFEMSISAPEPASLAVLGVGLLGLGFSRFRAKKTST